jgi:hypothetical protein
VYLNNLKKELHSLGKDPWYPVETKLCSPWGHLGYCGGERFTPRVPLFLLSVGEAAAVGIVVF